MIRPPNERLSLAVAQVTALKPTILLASTNNWLSPVRMAGTLSDLGCGVQAVCTSRNALTVSSAVERAHRYSSFRPTHSIKAAIDAAKPELVLPCDDLATAHLHAIYERESRNGLSRSSATVELLVRSMGSPAGYSIIDSRQRFLTMAREEGVLVPNSAPAPVLSSLDTWMRENGVPAVLKRDCTSGGEGVQIVETPEQARRAFRRLASRRPTAAIFKRVLIDRDNTPLARLLRLEQPEVSVQQFVAGQDANIVVACWQGEVLAQIAATVLRTRGPKAPAAVIRLVENRDMSSAVKKIVRRLALSGFAGFDFVIEDGTNKPFLIEINPRATQASHLQLGIGRDLGAALVASLSGRRPARRPAVTKRDTIVLWPHVPEDLLPPELVEKAFFDAPLNDPEVVRLYVSSRKRFTLFNAMKSLWNAARA
jgi:Carbamoyl-phosphate synthase L chain, ATP binding domain